MNDTKTTITLPELLAPAGNTERLEAAFRFGADAVYLGASFMSLRNYAENFSPEQLLYACNYAHEREKRVYLACNAFARDDDLDRLPELLQLADDAGVDALIINDPGVLSLTRKYCPDLPLHLSTQANTLNSEAAMFWHEQGVKRIILARELTLDQIRTIRDKTPDTLELEMFVHGAMCVSYSGRCLLSNYITDRDANRGECAQPCRWTYELRERGKDGEYFSIEQDERGTYILNSRDLKLIEHIADIIDTGVCSLKIEGRMKSVSYVATVVNAYRIALNAYGEALRQNKPFRLPEGLEYELDSVSHRPYTTAFVLSADNPSIQNTKSSGYVSDAKICGVVLDYNEENKTAFIRQRNRFFKGDELEALSPGKIGRKFTVERIVDEDGTEQTSAPHPNQRLHITCEIPVIPGDILRKRL